MSEGDIILLTWVYIVITFPVTILLSKLDRLILRDGMLLTLTAVHCYFDGLIFALVQFSILAAANLYIQWRNKPKHKLIYDAFATPTPIAPAGLDMRKEF